MTEWRMALPMYGVTAAARAAQDALLTRLKSHLQNVGWEGRIVSVVPEGSLYKHWLDPNLLFSQTCGYPLMTSLRDKVTLLGAPRYRCAGCFETHYSSRIVVRDSDAQASLSEYRGRIAAINSEDSHSGMNALRHALIPYAIASVGHAQGDAFFSDVVISGGHLRSLALLRSGEVDVAAIDAVTWSLLEDSEPEHLTGLHTLQYSVSTPTLPFIGSRHLTERQQQMIHTALRTLLVEDGALLEVLRITHVDAADWRAYLAVLIMEAQARNAGVASLPASVR